MPETLCWSDALAAAFAIAVRKIDLSVNCGGIVCTSAASQRDAQKDAAKKPTTVMSLRDTLTSSAYFGRSELYDKVFEGSDEGVS